MTDQPRADAPDAPAGLYGAPVAPPTRPAKISSNPEGLNHLPFALDEVVDPPEKRGKTML